MGRAIVRDPDVFLFDEPLSNLDAKLRTQMRTEIKKLHAKVQSTVIYVTHDQVEAMTLADRIVIMRDGYIEQVGTPDEVFRRPGDPLRRGLHRLAADEPRTRRRSTTGELVFASGETAAAARPVQGRVSRPGDKVVFGLRPDDIYPTGHGIHSGEASRRPRDRAAGHHHRAARQRDAGVRRVRRRATGCRACSTPSRCKPARRCSMSLDLSQAHLFDAETGKTLRS